MDDAAAQSDEQALRCCCGLASSKTLARAKEQSAAYAHSKGRNWPTGHPHSEIRRPSAVRASIMAAAAAAARQQIMRRSLGFFERMGRIVAPVEAPLPPPVPPSQSLLGSARPICRARPHRGRGGGRRSENRRGRRGVLSRPSRP